MESMEDRRLENRDPVHVARSLGSAHDADIAEALNAIEPGAAARVLAALPFDQADRKSTRLNSSHSQISYAVFCLKKKKKKNPILTNHLTTNSNILCMTFVIKTVR